MAPTPSRPPPGALAATVVVALSLGACGGSGAGKPRPATSATTPTTSAPVAAPAVPSSIRLTLAGARDGGSLPRAYTCDGVDDAPPLRWSAVPAGTRELALLLEDRDARGETGGPFVHWSVFAIPASATSVPPAAKAGTTDFHQTSYGGPCPPVSDPPHRYVFTLYALRAPLDLPPGAPPGDLRAAIARAALAQGRLRVSYARAGG